MIGSGVPRYGAGVEESERRGLAVLAAGADDLGWADAGEEDARRELIEAAHPEFASALDSGVHEVIVGGQVVNAALHVSLHEIVATQLWNDDPSELWQTAVRLTALGYDRHVVLHMRDADRRPRRWPTAPPVELPPAASDRTADRAAEPAGLGPAQSPGLSRHPAGRELVQRFAARCPGAHR